MRFQSHRSISLRSPFPGKIVFFYLAIILVSALFTCEAWTQPRYGGKLRLGIEYQSYGFDAIKGRMFTATSLTAAHLVMDRLFDMGEDGQIKPLLGLSASPSTDGKTWIIDLRKGIQFHDGTPFNADAVVEHWNRLLNPKNRFRGLLSIKTIQSVEKTEEFTVRFQLKHPWRPFLSMLSADYTIASLIPSPKAVSDDSQNHAPVGTGPFIFKSWKKQDQITLTKNPHYWQKGKPYLDEVVLRIIPDAQSRYATLLSRQIDILHTDRPSHIRKLKTDPNFLTVTGNGRGAGDLIMNTKRPPLDDVRVRQALAHAWDQKKYIQMVYQDTVPFSPHWYGSNFSCEKVSYRYPDLNKARALLKEYGKPVKIEYIHSATQRGKESALIIQQLLKAIGVAVKTVPMEWSAIYKRMFERKFDLASAGIPGWKDMGVATRLLFHSKSPWNLSGYSNTNVDQLLIKQELIMDQEDRKKIWCQVARHVNKDAPILLLGGRRYYLFTTLKVRGVPEPENINPLLRDVWLTQ